jgi:glycosyltransferase involved in cell wall biosynthesis
VVPCYNYGRYLPAAVGSILSQEGVDVDVIIVDDASEDGSSDVARALEESDVRVRAIVHEKNAGHIATYNDGLSQAGGEYVVLLSADDALVPGSLARAVALMERFPNVGMVYGHSQSFQEEPPHVNGRPRSWTVWNGRDWLSAMSRRAVNPVYTPGVVMRRAAWADVARYDARVPHAADMLLWYQTAVRWDIGRVNNQAQAYYRVHGANMHMTQFSGLLRDMREQREVLRIAFEESADHPLPRAWLLDGYRALARRARRLAHAEARESGAREIADDYLAFADETIEFIPEAAPARSAERFDVWIESPGTSFVRRALGHLEWRRWRRYGV